MYPRHFTQRNFDIEFLKDKRLFSSYVAKERKEKKKRKVTILILSVLNEKLFKPDQKYPAAGPTLQLSAIGERETKRRRREQEHVSEAKNHAGRNNRSHSTPWYISIHKYTLCTFSKPPFIRRGETGERNHFQTFDDCRNRIVTWKIRTKAQRGG